MMLRWLFGFVATPKPLPPPTVVDESQNGHRYAAALELERRLYESAIAAVDQAFAKEGLVAAFLTSGAIVAFASSLAAFAQLIPSVGQHAAWIVTAMLGLSLVLLVISVISFTTVLRGWKVQDIADAEKFLNMAVPAVTKDEVALQLMVEYRQARINHEEMVRDRLRYTVGAMRWLGAATLVAFLAILVALVSVSIQKGSSQPSFDPTKVDRDVPMSGEKPLYNQIMDKKPSTQKPAPVVFPKPSGGTTMIKGGGGDGTRK